MNAVNISAMKTPELVALYNQMSSKAIKKFSDRATGEKQVAKLLAEKNGGVPPAPKNMWPHPSSPIAPKGKKAVEAAAKAPAAKAPAAKAAKKEKPAPKPKRSADEVYAARATAIHNSWQDKKVSAARKERTHVSVSGGRLIESKQFRSVLHAFQELKLPVSKHIPFRMALKEAGTSKKFEDYTFRVFTPKE